MMMMMMGGERNQQQNHPTVHVPPWSLFDESTAGMVYNLPVSGVNNVHSNGSSVCSGGGSGYSGNSSSYSGEYSPLLMSEALTALQRYLPSNETDSDSEILGRESDIAMDSYFCDEFRMYEFKIRRCVRGRSHDWTECPYAHPGEKARRRDPRKFHYSGTACPDFRKGNCKRGDTCEYAHGVFECWLHPARYRTQPCKDGTSCRRRVCFFAHTPEQLRVLPTQQSPKSVSESPPSYDGSPFRVALDSYFSGGSSMFNNSSPTSASISPPISPSDSPPMSPNTCLNRPIGCNSVNEIVSSFRNLQLNKLKSPPCSWGGVQIGSGFCSPRASSTLRPGFSSSPTTPTRIPTRSGIGYLEYLDRCGPLEEEPAMERVESGRNIRSKIYEKLSKENSLEREERADSVPVPGPDVGWVSELVK